MDILKCKCMLYPTKMKIEDSPVGTLFGYECKRCGKSARAQSPIMAATLWNDKHGAVCIAYSHGVGGQPKRINTVELLKCEQCGTLPFFNLAFTSLECPNCRNYSGIHRSEQQAVSVWNRLYGERSVVIAQNHNKGQVAEPQGDFFAAVASEVEYSTVRHPWHNLRPGQIYDALKGENLELADAMLTEDYRQIMTEATHVAGMCKRIYEQAREAMRKKRVAG